MGETNRILALILFSFAPVAWPQAVYRPASTGSPDASQTLESAQREWSQANTVLDEAARRLNPCSLRISALLVEVRENAAILARANARYYRALLVDARQSLDDDRTVAAGTASAIEELRAAEAVIQREREVVESKRRQLPPAGSEAIRSALNRIDPLKPGPDAEAKADPAPVPESMRDIVGAKEKLIAQIETLTATEANLWKAYYDALEAGIRQRCSESSGRAPAQPKRGRR